MPPPPAHSVPNDLRTRQRVETHDISSDLITEAGAREQLSTYSIIRIEKANRDHDVDEEGYRMPQSWQRATHTAQTDMSKPQATRKVHELENFSDPVADKKSSMSADIQRQIERAHDKLEATDPDSRYYYILAQLDWQERKIEVQPQVEYRYKTKKGKKVLAEVSKRSKPKRRRERVSVTAYFKRTPKPEMNAMEMLSDQELARESHMRPLSGQPPLGFSQPMMHLEPPKHPGQMEPAQMHPGPLPPGPGHSGPGHSGPPIPPAHHMPPAQQRGAHQNFNQAKIEKIKPGNSAKPMIMTRSSKAVKMNHRSPRSSRSSVYSDDTSSSFGDSEMTPNSSVGSSSRYSHHKKHRDRSRGRSRHRERPEFFGHNVPRRHSKHDQDFSIELNPPRVLAPPPPRPLPYAIEMQRPVDEPYFDDFRQRAALRPRGRALAPAVIQAPHSFRRVPAFEARQEIYAEDIDRMQDNLERLRMEDDIRQERELRLEQDARYDQQEADLFRDRRLQERLRRDRIDDERWQPVQDRSWPERSAQQYMLRRERSGGFEQDHPFAPRRTTYQ